MKEIYVEEAEEDSIAYESFSNSFIHEDDVKHYIDDEIDYNKASDAFAIVSNVSISCCYDESDVLSSHENPVVYMKAFFQAYHGTKIYECQD
jgi:hypothetical protein